MKKILLPSTTFLVLLSVALPSSFADAALINRVNEAFKAVYGNDPTPSQWEYWAQRVQRGEKKSFESLFGAISFNKDHNPFGIPEGKVLGATTAAASGFKVDKSAYPSPHNPNFLPEGTLIKSPSSPNVYYVYGGKKSWVLPSILNKWLGENHYFKHDIIITISEADLARYPTRSSINPIYIGKVLQHPDGTQYMIDDKLRKRQIMSPAIRKAFRMPEGNLYPTTANHLQEFTTGPAITNADHYIGGMVVYVGPYHGGRFWRIQEVEGGKVVKRLYLTDYLYEADGNPDETFRMPVVDKIFARHARGTNISTYPNGWVVGLGSNIYVVQDGRLRLITSPDLFAAMGYKAKYVVRVFPEFLKQYPHGPSIYAFKSIVISGAPKGGVTAAPSTSAQLIKVRPGIRTLINDVNNIYISVFDKDVTASENKFWVDYLYNGEVNNKTDLIATMERARITGQKPARTSRTAQISLDKLKSHWFPYLFYFVHQKEPSDADREYWYGRIRSGDRDTIEKLGGTIQWLKDTEEKTRK